MATSAAANAPRPPRFHPADGLVAAAGVLLLVLALHGVAAPFAFGHYGYHGGEYSTRARHTLRHGTILPANLPGWIYPPKDQYYLHHPILTHHLVTITMTLLGDHEYAVRAAAVVSFAASFLLLVLLVRSRWGPWQAALAGAAYVLVPIDVWFANHIDPGFPSIVCVLLFFGFYLRWLETARWRTAAAALVAMALAGGFEWSPFLAAIPIGAHVVWTAIRRRGRYLTFVPLYALAVILPLAIHFLLVWKTGHWPEMKASYKMRSAGPDTWAFLVQVWGIAKAMYGPLAWLLLPWSVTRLVLLVSGRAPARDLLGWSFALAMLLYMLLFRNAVLIHAYRLLYGNVVCAVAAVDLAALLVKGSGWALDRIGKRRIGEWVVGGVVAAVFLLEVAPPARVAHGESRRKGGIPLWGSYNPELAKISLMQAARERTEPGEFVLVHPNYAWRAEYNYYVDRDVRLNVSATGLERVAQAVRDHSIFICIPGALTLNEKRALERQVRAHPAHLVDRYLIVDLRRPGPATTLELPTPRKLKNPLKQYLLGPYPALKRPEPQPIDLEGFLKRIGLANLPPPPKPSTTPVPPGRVGTTPRPGASKTPPPAPYHPFAPGRR